MTIQEVINGFWDNLDEIREDEDEFDFHMTKLRTKELQSRASLARLPYIDNSNKVALTEYYEVSIKQCMDFKAEVIKMFPERFV